MGAAEALHVTHSAPRSVTAAGAGRSIPAPPASGVHPRLALARPLASRLVGAAMADQSAGEIASRADVPRQHAQQWADPDSERLPTLGHVLAERGSWAASLLRLSLAEVEGRRPAALSPVQAAELALQVLEATEALLRFVSASTRGKLTPELTLDAAKASLTIHRLTGDLHPGLLTLAREGR